MTLTFTVTLQVIIMQTKQGIDRLWGIWKAKYKRYDNSRYGNFANNVNTYVSVSRGSAGYLCAPYNEGASGGFG